MGDEGGFRGVFCVTAFDPLRSIVSFDIVWVPHIVRRKMSIKIWSETTIEPVDKLQQMRWPDNPRTIDDRAREKLEGSLDEYGQVEPLVVNRRTNTLISGHQRLAAAVAQGAEELAVVWVDIPQDKQAALGVMLNNPDAQGRWDNAKLAGLFAQIRSTHQRIGDLTGFDDDKIRRIITRARASAAQRAAEETPPPKPQGQPEESSEGVPGDVDPPPAPRTKWVLFSVNCTDTERAEIEKALDIVQKSGKLGDRRAALLSLARRINHAAE